jgi:hypothetical protein
VAPLVCGASARSRPCGQLINCPGGQLTAGKAGDLPLATATLALATAGANDRKGTKVNKVRASDATSALLLQALAQAGPAKSLTAVVAATAALLVATAATAAASPATACERGQHQKARVRRRESKGASQKARAKRRE